MTEYPKVSVVTITYGHEDYITETLDGVLMQNYPGQIEFIIANDSSPDNTDMVVKNYFSNNNVPSNFSIRYTKHKVNKGMIANFIWALEQTSGKYIALCEGDDYWTDPLKLQKQVGFLENKVEYVLHSGKAQFSRDAILGNVFGNPLSKSTYNIGDFLTKNNLISHTVMFRNIPIPTNHFQDLTFCDWMLYVLLLSHNSGNLAFVSDELYSVYRIHEGGVMQTLTNKSDSNFAHFRQIVSINNFLHCNYTQADIYRINDYAVSVFACLLNNKYYKKSFNILAKHYSLTKNKFPIRNYLGLLKNHLFNNKNA